MIILKHALEFYTSASFDETDGLRGQGVGKPCQSLGQRVGRCAENIVVGIVFVAGSGPHVFGMFADTENFKGMNPCCGFSVRQPLTSAADFSLCSAAAAAAASPDCPADYSAVY